MPTFVKTAIELVQQKHFMFD